MFLFLPCSSPVTALLDGTAGDQLNFVTINGCVDSPGTKFDENAKLDTRRSQLRLREEGATKNAVGRPTETDDARARVTCPSSGDDQPLPVAGLVGVPVELVAQRIDATKSNAANQTTIITTTTTTMPIVFFCSFPRFHSESVSGATSMSSFFSNLTGALLALASNVSRGIVA